MAILRFVWISSILDDILYQFILWYEADLEVQTGEREGRA